MLADDTALIAFSLCAESWRARDFITAWGVERSVAGWTVRVLVPNNIWHEATNASLELAVTTVSQLMGDL